MKQKRHRTEETIDSVSGGRKEFPSRYFTTEIHIWRYEFGRCQTTKKLEKTNIEDKKKLFEYMLENSDLVSQRIKVVILMQKKQIFRYGLRSVGRARRNIVGASINRCQAKHVLFKQRQ